MFKQGFIILSLLLLGTTTYADPITTSDPVFVGKYHCNGVDPYLDKTYSGTVTVTHTNAVYTLDMKYDTDEDAKGTGGQYNPTLMSVVFQDVKNPKNIGLEQYTMNADKTTMQGFWVYLGQDKLGKEVCERIKE